MKQSGSVSSTWCMEFAMVEFSRVASSMPCWRSAVQSRSCCSGYSWSAPFLEASSSQKSRSSIAWKKFSPVEQDASESDTGEFEPVEYTPTKNSRVKCQGGSEPHWSASKIGGVQWQLALEVAGVGAMQLASAGKVSHKFHQSSVKASVFRFTPWSLSRQFMLSG